MRARGLRLGRSFHRIVLALLATPAGCSSPDANGPTPLDASLPPSGDAAPPADARPLDATRGDAAQDTGADAGPIEDLDGAACDPISIDGADIEVIPDACGVFRLLPCGLPGGAQVEGCLVDLATCAHSCGESPIYCQLAPTICSDAGVVADAATVLECLTCGGITGRRPLGLRRARGGSRAARPSSLGDYFATMAHLEAASVRAFRDLERWLLAHGAPARLARAARRAASDERRHARAASRLARRFAGAPAPPRVRTVPTPTLAALLEDDVLEGCVGESFGALVATFQSARAEDAAVRRAMRTIATEETRHAALAWEILRWGAPRLAPEGARGLERAFDRALAALQRRASAPVDDAVRRACGHPSAEELRLLARALADVVRAEREALAPSFG